MCACTCACARASVGLVARACRCVCVRRGEGCRPDTVEPLPCDAAVGTVTFLCDCVEDGGAGLDLPALQLLGASALCALLPRSVFGG